MKQFKAMVIKEHPIVSKVFPLGFETTYKKIYSVSEKTIKGWTNTVQYIEYEDTGRKSNGTKVMKSVQKEKEEIIPDTIIPKGTFLDVTFVSIDGTEYCGEWFYKMTGKPFSEFFTKL